MRQSMHRGARLALGSLGAAAALLLAGPAAAQQGGPTLRERLLGTWELKEIYLEANGTRRNQFGDNPKGFLMYTPDGHFVVFVQRSDLPRFAARNREQGTPEENRAVVQGSVAYVGRFTVDEAKQSIESQVQGSTYPNIDGAKLLATQRTFSADGSVMTTYQPSPTLSGTVHTVWKRVP